MIIFISAFLFCKHNGKIETGASLPQRSSLSCGKNISRKALGARLCEARQAMLASCLFFKHFKGILVPKLKEIRPFIKGSDFKGNASAISMQLLFQFPARKPGHRGLVVGAPLCWCDLWGPGRDKPPSSPQPRISSPSTLSAAMQWFTFHVCSFYQGLQWYCSIHASDVPLHLRQKPTPSLSPRASYRMRCAIQVHSRIH